MVQNYPNSIGNFGVKAAITQYVLRVIICSLRIAVVGHAFFFAVLGQRY